MKVNTYQISFSQIQKLSFMNRGKILWFQENHKAVQNVAKKSTTSCFLLWWKSTGLRLSSFCADSMHFLLSGSKNQIIRALIASIDAAIHHKNCKLYQLKIVPNAGHMINHIQNIAQTRPIFFVRSSGFDISLI